MKYISAIIFAIAIVLSAYFLGSSYVSRANPDGVISVTGSGSENFTSDPIVWEASFPEPILTWNRLIKTLIRIKKRFTIILFPRG